MTCHLNLIKMMMKWDVILLKVVQQLLQHFMKTQMQQKYLELSYLKINYIKMVFLLSSKQDDEFDEINQQLNKVLLSDTLKPAIV